MWAVWALIVIFFFSAPRAARSGSCLATGAFTVSRMVLEIPVLLLCNSTESLTYEAGEFLLFFF